MTTKEKRILQFEYWRLLVAQSAHKDEFRTNKPNQNIMQRIYQMQEIFFALGWGVPAYDEMDYLIKNQTWRFNIDKDGAHYYTYINPDGSVGSAVDHLPSYLKSFVRQGENFIR